MLCRHNLHSVVSVNWSEQLTWTETRRRSMCGGDNWVCGCMKGWNSTLGCWGEEGRVLLCGSEPSVRRQVRVREGFFQVAGWGGKARTLLHADSEVAPRSSPAAHDSHVYSAGHRTRSVCCTSLTIEVDECEVAAAARRRNRAALVDGNGGWASMFVECCPTHPHWIRGNCDTGYDQSMSGGNRYTVYSL